MMVVEPTLFGDARGYFMETYNYNEFAAAGLDMTFVQDNQSKSKRGVLRGLHFQTKNSQGKLFASSAARCSTWGWTCGKAAPPSANGTASF